MDRENTTKASFISKSFRPNLSLNGGGSSLPLSTTIDNETSDDLFEKQNSFIFMELPSLINRYNNTFCKLHSTISYLDSIRQESLALASKKLELLSLDQEDARSYKAPMEEISPSFCTVDLGLDGRIRPDNLKTERSKEPNEGDETNSAESVPNSTHSVLPKSISIRSRGFSTARHLSPRSSEMSSSRSCNPLRVRLPPTAALQENDSDEGELEVDAYSQGTPKTEMCNKWGELGWCPYAECCQFAHGIQELRPVIRHSRYKTQLCRNLAVTGSCPYGHRCHFRHSPALI